MLRRLIVLIGVASLLITGCDSSIPTDSVSITTSLPTRATDVVSTTTVTSLPVGTSSPITPMPAAPDLVPEPELWAAEEYDGPELGWEPTDLTIDRTERVWLGFVGDLAVLLAWNPIDGLSVRHSSDGVAWSAFAATTGIPDTFEPVLDIDTIAAGPHGIIMTGIEPDTTVLTSPDGTNWRLVDDTGSVESIAAGPAGFLLANRGNRECGARLSGDGVSWECVALPPTPEDPWDYMAMTGGAGFLIDSSGPLAVVGEGGVRTMAAPAVQDPLFTHSTPWRDGLVALARGRFAGAYPWRMALIGTDDFETWFELPVPFIAAATDWQGDGYWNVQTLAAGDRGILVTTFWPPEEFDFRGGAFASIPFAMEGVEGWIFGSRLFQMPSDGPEVVTSFDADGNLTMSDAESGEEIGTMSCEDMRAYAEGTDFLPGGLIGWPEQMVVYSPDGMAWDETAVAEVFGTDAYLLQVATDDDKALALVAPNGDRPMPDPPNCPLGLYPEEEPFEVWVTDLP